MTSYRSPTQHTLLLELAHHPHLHHPHGQVCDPSNNDYFATMYEWDLQEIQLRFGGDKLEYTQGMRMRAIYLSGTILLNMVWKADGAHLFFVLVFSFDARTAGYTPLNFESVTDPHWTLSTTGHNSSMHSMHEECTSSLTLLSAPCLTLLVSKVRMPWTVTSSSHSFQVLEHIRSFHPQRVQCCVQYKNPN